MTNYKITQHATIRFLQRVFKIKEPTTQEIQRAKILLEKDLKDVYINPLNFYLVLPSFSNFKAVVKNNTLVTILNKRYPEGA